jgi:uncharacterized protein with HEPN domain
MAKRSVIVRCQDILAAIDEAVEILDGADFAAYVRSAAKRRGIERCVEIISEAARHIPAELCDKHPEVPWPEVRSIGNLLRHEYSRVDDLVIWRIATESLTDLQAAVRSILDGIEE